MFPSLMLGSQLIYYCVAVALHKILLKKEGKNRISVHIGLGSIIFCIGTRVLKHRDDITYVHL